MDSKAGTPPVRLSGWPTSPQHPEGSEALADLLHELADPERGGEAVEQARRAVALLLNAAPRQVVFTSGGVEASNAAIKGLALAALTTRRSRRIVVPVVEHAPVYHAARGLERLGFEIVDIPADRNGVVDAAAFERALRPGAALAALQWANDEFGSLQPVAEAALATARFEVPLHVDATAAAGWVPIDFAASGAATLSVSSRSLGGPVGAGALLIADGHRWLPLIEGGVEQDGRRAGPLHPALISAFGRSAGAAADHLALRAGLAGQRRDELDAACRAAVTPLHRLGSIDAALPGHLALSVPGVPGEALLLDLERSGILADSGSACAEAAGLPSRILRAAGVGIEEARSSLLFRVTAQIGTEVPQRVAGALKDAVVRLRALAP